ncbi:AAA-type ATPase lid domain-containing protein [Cyclonatronum proteinivorum]|uniref:hypothetical protein n=1 Tax=Cyclonatronum proteinivorum TaxID=1457365 RepID=UPI0013DF285C|nr:hypothetical protein [Cyclonatronum proteinivorum]
MNSLFWREMLDKLPATVLIFKIDEQEQARLLLTNSHIRKDLGFSPEEYVLASESEESPITAELDLLIDEVARLSHASAPPDSLPSAVLSNRQGEQMRFGFSFSVFQSKANRSNLISVALVPALIRNAVFSTEGPADGHRQNGVQENNTEVAAAKGDVIPPPPFVAVSEVMKGVLEKADHAAGIEAHILLHGEIATGKRAIASRIEKTCVFAKPGTQVMHIDFRAEAAEASFQKIVERDQTSGAYLLAQLPKNLILQIRALDNIKIPQLETIAEIIDERQARDYRTRLIMTSRISLDQLSESGRIPASLLYKYTFFPIPVPPLRHRREDLPEIIEIWLSRLVAAADLRPAPAYTPQQMQQLLQHEWPENFQSLKEVIRASVLSANGEKLPLRLGIKTFGEGKQAGLFGGALAPELQQVLSYDEMSRVYFRHVLDLTKGKIYGDDGAAALLGMPPTTLQSKLKKLKVKPPK